MTANAAPPIDARTEARNLMGEGIVATERTYLVVVNHEEQHSIWLEGQEVPAGWTPLGFSGTRQECLDHIAEVWTDITPLSVRQQLAER